MARWRKPRSTRVNVQSFSRGPSLNRAAGGRLWGGTVGLGFILAASGATAQEPKSDDVALPPVEVQGTRRQGYQIMQSDLLRLPEDLKDLPQSITVIPREVIQERADFSLRDTLRNVTGISLAAGEGGFQGDNLTLRGFSARGDIFLDGVREVGNYTRDTFNLEAVEVLKGPSSVFFGRGSTGGVVNQVSKAPHLTPDYFGSLTLGTGPLARGTLDINQPVSPTAAFRINALAHHSETEGRDYVEAERFGVAPSITFGLGTSTRLTFSYYYQHEDNIPDDGLPYLLDKPAPVRRANFYGLADRDFEITNTHILTGRLDHTFNASVQLRSILRYGIFERDHEITAPRIAGTPTPATPLEDIVVNRGRPSRERTDTSANSVTDVVTRFETWGFKHTLVTGLELGWETSDSTTFSFTGVPTASLLHPTALPDISQVKKTTNQVTEATALTVGVYAVDELAITDQWKLVGGVRFDAFDTQFENKTTNLDLDRDDHYFNPRAALVFQPTASQTYYASYGTSVNPSAENLTLAANNVNTDPEKNTSYEVGAKWELLGSRMAVTTALFQIDKTDARTSEPGGAVLVLDGEQRVRGFEIGVVGRPLPGWNVFVGYTFLDSEIVEAKEVQNGVPIQGKELANVPEHTVSLWTTYDITPRWQVGGGLVYVSSRFANNANTIEVPGYVRGDLTAAYRPTRWLEVRLNVLNVSDEEYFESVYTGHVVPGAGRTFLLTASFQF